jgi:hypothetical protein
MCLPLFVSLFFEGVRDWDGSMLLCYLRIRG